MQFSLTQQHREGLSIMFSFTFDVIQRAAVAPFALRLYMDQLQ
jgi:hypothetical protein